MQSFLWFVSQMTLLLLAAAVIFFLLGWRWRRHDASAHAVSGPATMTGDSATAERTQMEKEARAALAQELTAAKRDAAELQEARERQRQLERELLRLSEELKTVKQTKPEREGPPTVLPASEPPAAEESQPREKPAATAPSAPQPLPTKSPAPEAKPKVRKSPGEIKSGATGMKAQEVAASLGAKISSQQVLVGALNQEREGWQQRMDALKSKAAIDPAGFALTTKNLARSESQYRDAIQHLKTLQRQAGAIERVPTVADNEDDDLTQIKGIKSALDQQLRAFGIRTYRQIAAMSATDLEAFSELLSFKNRAQRDQWQEQARELHRKKHGADVGA